MTPKTYQYIGELEGEPGSTGLEETTTSVSPPYHRKVVQSLQVPTARKCRTWIPDLKHWSGGMISELEAFEAFRGLVGLELTMMVEGTR